LSIVRTVAVAHGGLASVTVPPTGGLEVRVTLPALPGTAAHPATGYQSALSRG